MGMAREEPVLMIGEKVKATMREFRQRNGRAVSSHKPYLQSSLIPPKPNKVEYYSLKKELLDDIMAKAVPEDVLTRVSSHAC